MSRRLDDLDLVAFMVDGAGFGEHCCVLALGIDIDGVKHPLALEEGSTENATLVTDLITGLRDRGPGVTKPSWRSSTGRRPWPKRSRTSPASRSSKDARNTEAVNIQCGVLVRASR